jgi:hypothetical protein
MKCRLLLVPIVCFTFMPVRKNTFLLSFDLHHVEIWHPNTEPPSNRAALSGHHAGIPSISGGGSPIQESGGSCSSTPGKAACLIISRTSNYSREMVNLTRLRLQGDGCSNQLNTPVLMHPKSASHSVLAPRRSAVS